MPPLVFPFTINSRFLFVVNRQEVLATVFAYLDLMRATGPQPWVTLEIQRLSEMRWRWMEKGPPGSTAERLATSLQHPFPDERILVGARLAPDPFNPELIKKALDTLKVENCRVFIGSKEPLEGREVWSLKEQ